MRLRHMATIGIAAGLSVSAFAQGPILHGNWEVTTRIEMPGMPMQMPPTTSKQCLTPQDVATPSNVVPSDPQSKCTVSDFELKNNTATWNAKCATGSGRGEIVYGNDGNYAGTLKLTVAEINQEMTIRFTGKRVGDCVK